MNRSLLSSACAALFAGALCIPLPSQATIFTLHATLNGAQEVPPTGSPGIGFGTVILDDVAMTITVDLSFSGLTTGAIMAHLHEAPAGFDGPIEFPLDLGSALGQTSGSIPHQVIALTEPDDPEEFLNSEYYFNIHTTEFPDGEIRGQVIPAGLPEPGSLLLMSLGAMGAFGVRRTKRRDA